MADSRRLAHAARCHALRMVAAVNASHIGTCLSMADLLAVLYADVLRVDPAAPAAPDRDRFLLSKGHGAAILYAVLAERGFFPVGQLADYCRDGSPLTGHANFKVPGVELSTGSLGHGPPVACGLALAARRAGRPYRTHVLVSDGEMDEGSNWEAVLFAGHHRLDNLVLVVDYNKIQSFGTVAEVLDLEPLADKFRAFRWHVVECDGHDHPAVGAAFAEAAATAGRPTAVVAHTTKGKGVGYMHDLLAWHYKSPNPDQLAAALAELGAGP